MKKLVLQVIMWMLKDLIIIETIWAVLLFQCFTVQ